MKNDSVETGNVAAKAASWMKEGTLVADRYRLEQLLSAGTHSQVWKASDTGKKSAVALKFFACDKALDPIIVQLLQQEFTSSILKHPRILVPQHFAFEGRRPYLVMPLVTAGSLRDLLARKKTAPVIDEARMVAFMGAVASALSFLHKNTYVHQDVCPENILITGSAEYCLTDFGISRLLHNTLGHASGPHRILHTAYASPERYEGQPANPPDDVFALGALLFEMANGFAPLGPHGGEALLKKTAGLPPFDASLSEEFSDIVRACLDRVPESRPSAADLEKWVAAYTPMSVEQILERREQRSRDAADAEEKKRRIHEAAQAREAAERAAREAAMEKLREAAERKKRKGSGALQDAAGGETQDRQSGAAQQRDEALQALAQAEQRAREEEQRRIESERALREQEQRRIESERALREEMEANMRRMFEQKAREDAERKALQEAEDRARKDEERKRKEEERKRREEREAREREERERTLRLELEKRVREELEQKAREEEEKRLRLDAERRAREEAERREREEAERREREEAERREREEAERRAREEAEFRAREEAARRVREEAEQKAREEAERRKREEAERRAREEAERKAREEAERRKREEAEHRAREEAERRVREAAEQRAREEAEHRIREEEERRIRDEERRIRDEERRIREEEERRAQEAVERHIAEETQRILHEEAERAARREALAVASMQPPRTASQADQDLQRRIAELEQRLAEESERRAKEVEARMQHDAEEQRRMAAWEEALQRDFRERLEEETAKRLREVQEHQIREEERRRLRMEEENARRDAEEQRRRADLERAVREETERLAREQAERRAREEVERVMREEAERRAREDEQRRAKEEADRLAREEAERRRLAEIERKVREEAERHAREEVERKSRETAERLERAAEARRRKEEAAWRAREEAERQRIADLEARLRDEAQKTVRDELERALAQAKQAAEQAAAELAAAAATAAAATAAAAAAAAATPVAPPDIAGNTTREAAPATAASDGADRALWDASATLLSSEAGESILHGGAETPALPQAFVAPSTPADASMDALLETLKEQLELEEQQTVSSLAAVHASSEPGRREPRPAASASAASESGAQARPADPVEGDASTADDVQGAAARRGSRSGYESRGFAWSVRIGFAVLGLVALWFIFPGGGLGTRNSTILHLRSSLGESDSLVTALARGYLTALGGTDIRVEHAGGAIRVTASCAGGDSVKTIECLSGSASSNLDALQRDGAQLVFTQRPLRREEALRLGNDATLDGDYTLAIDAACIIVPADGVGAMDAAQIRDVFTGATGDWSRAGRRRGAIRVYAARDGAALAALRLTLLGDAALLPAAVLCENDADVAAQVAQDPNGIGIVGRRHEGGTRVVAVRSAGRTTMPNDLSLRMEEYPLAVQLHAWLKASNDDETVRGFLAYALSASGQAAVRAAGFGDQAVELQPPVASASATPAYREATRDLLRLTPALRLRDGSTEFEDRAIEDIQRVANFLARPEQRGFSLVLVALSDRMGNRESELLVARTLLDRAAARFAKLGITPVATHALGADAPVLDDALPGAARRNRRVELYLRMGS